MVGVGVFALTVGVARLSIWRFRKSSRRFTLALLLTGIGLLLPPTALDPDTSNFGVRLLYTALAALACELYGWVLISALALQPDETYKPWFGPVVWCWRAIVAAMAAGMLFPGLAPFGSIVVVLMAITVGALGVTTLVQVFRRAQVSVQMAAAVLVGGCGLVQLGFVTVALWGMRQDPDWLASNGELVSTFVTAPVAVTVTIAGVLGLWSAWRARCKGRRVGIEKL
ncbi:hypothetical protein [Nocardia sp. NPDC051833]|uniref:hypothetical protein n=1 Tax=Nocardia sp. NPDC051833 TaxID=3155674 RepID=UPI003415AD6E